MLEGVDARRVPVAPPEAEGIPAHRLNGERADIPVDRLLAEPLLAGQLIDALGTATAEPERVAGVEAVVPVLPANADLGRRRLGDLRGLRALIRHAAAQLERATAAARFSATWTKAWALGESGIDWTMGRPSSEVVRISVASGISPRKGMLFTIA